MSEILEQTSYALEEYVVDRGLIAGIHGSTQTQIGGKGRVISDAPLHPSTLDLTAIDPFSIDSIAFGQLNVTRTIPDKRLNVSVIVQADRSKDHPGIIAAKSRLAETLMDTLDASMPHRRDRVLSYYLGADELSINGEDIEALPYSDDPGVNAKTIAEVCQDGLTFVIGDFKRLQFDTTQRRMLQAAVAIKLNHPFELEIPANTGRWTLSVSEVLDSHNKRKLAAANGNLLDNHTQQISLLRAAGFAVATVVTDPRDHKWGFDYDTADKAIADAVTTVATRK